MVAVNLWNPKLITTILSFVRGKVSRRSDGWRDDQVVGCPLSGKVLVPRLLGHPGASPEVSVQRFRVGSSDGWKLEGGRSDSWWLSDLTSHLRCVMMCWVWESLRVQLNVSISETWGAYEVLVNSRSRDCIRWNETVWRFRISQAVAEVRSSGFSGTKIVLNRWLMTQMATLGSRAKNKRRKLRFSVPTLTAIILVFWRKKSLKLSFENPILLCYATLPLKPVKAELNFRPYFGRKFV